jgi:1-deoxy-D-xylulose-5-phosphate synthase
MLAEPSSDGGNGMDGLDALAPGDVAALPTEQVPELCARIRERLIGAVCRTGGHLGPNLGVVELTVALHRVFESPRVPLVFDTGHQAYVHKILTGRGAELAGLRTAGGISGYPSRAESKHDVVENSHASTALSYADGLTKAFALAGEPDRRVVVVVGDGALTGGLAWEALNNLGRSGRRVVVVLNDNGRSYAPTIGALPEHLRRLHRRSGFAELHDALGRGPSHDAGPAARDGDGESVFGALGFGYLGPVDGHDTEALEEAFRRAGGWPGPVVVHCLTTKGRGYLPALQNVADHMHTVGVIEPATGVAAASTPTWTDVFGEAMVAVGDERDDVVAISAAMVGPTGLAPFAEKFPERAFDVGIAEQHAVTSAAGLAMGGRHPVVALYATFLNRAFDQVLLDVGLHRQPMTLVLDRAGVTGPDGASHHGMWDLAVLGIVPGMRVAAPRDAETLLAELRETVAIPGPTAVRFPKASVAPSLPAVAHVGGTDLLRVPEAEEAEVLLVAVGALAGATVDAAEMLSDLGVECTVVDPRWALPMPDAVVDLARRHALVVTVEDGIRAGGAGSRLALQLADAGVDTPVRQLGLPSAYLPHGARRDILATHGLDAHGIAASVKEAVGQRAGRAWR